MKTKDFIKQLALTAGITNADLDMFLAASAIPDDIPDSFNAEIQNKYLTRERALNDANIVSELQKKSNKSAYDTFDTKIKDFLPFIADQELIAKINAEPQSFQKWDILKAGLKSTFDGIEEKTKGKVNADANKILEEKSKEIKALQESHAAEMKAQNEKLNDIFINSKLKEGALSFNFADPYKPLKDNIADLVVSDIKKSYKVSLDDKGEIKLFMPAGESWVEAFDGNEKVTVQKLLEKGTKQFIAVSNGASKEVAKDTFIPDAGDASKMTLAERRRLAVPTLPN